MKTLRAANNYADSLVNLNERFEEAKSLMRKTITCGATRFRRES